MIIVGHEFTVFINMIFSYRNNYEYYSNYNKKDFASIQNNTDLYGLI